jgi:hypothetical protein
MEKIKYNVQAIKKFNRALRNVKQFGIVDKNPLESPESRKKSSPNYITTIPNTPENLQKARAILASKGIKVILYGRGPRTLNVKEATGGYPYYYNGSYPMSENPPYVALYRRVP